MDATTLQRLRPRDRSAAAIRDALGAIETERAGTAARLAELRAGRGPLLVTGTPKAVMAHDDAVREAETFLEQVAAMADALAPELEQTRAREAEAALRAAAAQAHSRAQAAAERWRVWWEGEYRRLAQALAQGLAMEREAHEATQAAHEADQALAGDAPVPRPKPLPGPLWRFRAGYDKQPARLGSMVQLPAAAEGEDAVWWPKLLIGRL